MAIDVGGTEGEDVLTVLTFADDDYVLAPVSYQAFTSVYRILLTARHHTLKYSRTPMGLFHSGL